MKTRIHRWSLALCLGVSQAEPALVPSLSMLGP